MIIDEEAYLAHYGILRRSGRYPYGSGHKGAAPYPWSSGNSQPARNRTYLDTITALRKQGISDPKIAEGFGISTTQLRSARTIANNQQKLYQINWAQRLHDKGMSNVAIGRKLGVGESQVRALLDPGVKDRADVLGSISNMLKAQVAEKKYIDVGTGVENTITTIGVSQEKLAAAIGLLQEQGYVKHPLNIPQLGTGKDTRMKILAAPGTTQREIFLNQHLIQQIAPYSTDGGRSFVKFHPPISIHPDRVDVVYKEQGGGKADGVIYVRPGVADLGMGGKQYAQVRIKVGDDHYLKGMAVYKTDLPHGIDLQFHTEKPQSVGKLGSMKPLHPDPNFPFESVVRQHVINPNTPHEHVTSAMNVVYDEGSWSHWSRNLSAQFLSKQTPQLAKAQLATTFDRRKKEFEAINALTNPTVKKKLLEEFAKETDSAAVHLKAAALKNSNWHVILPISSIKPSQIYAPNYNNGDRVVLIRYPHGGTFEIPELTVNNHNREAKALLGGTKDAVGIHHSVAVRLSGADFDGDTVLVIPNNSGKVKTTPALAGLKNFDPLIYKVPEGSGITRITPKRKEQEMGNISNLITDMTLKGASHDELARAIRHSMVVIDSEKKNLNYKLSAQVNGISQLKAEYQGGANRGAATLISRKKTNDYLPERKPRPQSEGGPVNRVTGRLEYVPKGSTRTLKSGERVPKREKINRLSTVEDAHSLSSGQRMESIYAEHSNALKSLANHARLQALDVPNLVYSKSANAHYQTEVKSLLAQLALAKKNAPLERQAQLLGAANLRAIRAANPSLDGDTLKKVKFQQLDIARIRTGAKKQQIEISQREWDAIQAGAISNHRLSQILNNANIDIVRNLATPRTPSTLSVVDSHQAHTLLDSGATRGEVAKRLGVSLSTLENSLKEQPHA